ncbi:MAG: methylmalonyl-CoA epimerase [Anaerolineae bacterium]|nr:methylmalonyl-CoA epimerase [Anaerolineae bacterium]
MIGRIDHIGIAVADLASALDFYDGMLGLPASEVEEVPDQGVRLAVLPVGESRLELLQSTAPDGPVGRFIEKRGEGIHHICFEVDDIEAALAALRDAGVRLIDEQPRTGVGGRRIAFLHPRSSHGVLIELSERPSAAHGEAPG